MAVTIDGTNGINDTVLGSSTPAAASVTTFTGTTVTAQTAFVPDASDGAALGTTALEFSDLFLADGAVINLGDDQDVTITHVADAGIMINAAMQLRFRDSAISISSTADGDLSIAADDEIDITSTLIDINGNLDVSGTALITGVTTHGDDVVSDTDSTDDLGTTGVRWANLFVDAITATDQITATGFTGTLDGILGSGAAAAATTTTLASTTITASGIIKTDDTTAATSTTDGSLQTDGGLSVAADAVIGDDLFMLSDASVLSFGADSEITLTHVHDTGLRLEDNDKMLFGTGSDLQIYHDGSNSYIVDSGTGDLVINTNGNAISLNPNGGGEYGLRVINNGAVNLYYDNALKLATSATGVTVTGGITGVTGLNSGQIGGRRNIVYNGEMKVAQRSTSVTGLGAAVGYFTLDRWNINVAGTAGRFTMAQVADGPPGFANCLKISTTTADTSIAAGELLLLEQKLEGQDLQQLKKGTAGAEQFTISFWVKGNANAVFVCEIFDVDNTRSITQSFAVTTSWNRIELTFAADTSDPLDDDNAFSLGIVFWLHAGSNLTSGTFAVNTWNDAVTANRVAVDDLTSILDATDRTFFITGVQMEIGATATEFESRTYGEELALCQRYYYQTVYGGSDTTIASGTAASATAVGQASSTHPVTMRVIPTLAEAGTLTAYDGTANGNIGISINSCSITNLSFNCTASSLTLGRAVQILANAAADYLTLTAEL